MKENYTDQQTLFPFKNNNNKNKLSEVSGNLPPLNKSL